VIPYCNSFGYDNDTPGKWWKNNEIVKSLELSNAQVDQIEKIFSSRKGKIKELGSNLRKKERELDNTIRNPNSSNEEVLKLSNEVEEIRGNLRKLKVDMFLQIREVLTPKQRGKLQEIRPKRGKPFR
jgi:Spy/CpxP family protein refolding chaperone